MRNSLLIFYLFASATGFAQIKRGQISLSTVARPTPHYLPEYTFDRPGDPGSWDKQGKGLHVSFGSTDALYLRSELPQLSVPSLEWEETGWRGERLNAQILLWATDSVDQIRLSASDFADGKGHTIAKSNIQLHLVRYVLSNFPYAATNSYCDVAVTDTAYLMPDRFEKFERFDLPGKTLRPVWLSVEIPGGAAPGAYNATLVVQAAGHSATMHLKINVQRPVLPKPHDWKFRLDLWQNPWVIASYYDVVPWSEEHKLLLRAHLKLYAEAGGKYITTYAIHSPWSDNSYRIEGGMIEWTKTAQGKWKFDYTVFDQYVQLAMEVGIDKAITIYTPVPWGNRFRYKEEASGNYVYAVWPPESAEFKTVWSTFLDDLKAHLLKKGWFEKAYIGINENPLPQTLAAARLVKEHSKDWKITYAGDWHPELTAVLDDYSPVLDKEPSLKEINARAAHGFTTTYYVACGPARPNNFVFSPPIEGRYMGWYAAASGYDGFLRWAYDAWPADPVRDARHTLWPAGDCFLVYPGGNSGIRFEKLREGIVDFEKMRILKEMASSSLNPKAVALMKDLEAHLASFVKERDFNKRDFSTQRMTEAIAKGRKLIAEVCAAL